MTSSNSNCIMMGRDAPEETNIIAMIGVGGQDLKPHIIKFGRAKRVWQIDILHQIVTSACDVMVHQRISKLGLEKFGFVERGKRESRFNVSASVSGDVGSCLFDFYVRRRCSRLFVTHF